LIVDAIAFALGSEQILHALFAPTFLEGRPLGLGGRQRAFEFALTVPGQLQVAFHLHALLTRIQQHDARPHLLGQQIFLHALHLAQCLNTRLQRTLILAEGVLFGPQPGEVFAQARLLGLIVGLTLAEELCLQPRLGVALGRRKAGLTAQFGLKPRDLRLQAVQARTQLRLVSRREGGIQGREPLTLLHDLSDAHIQTLDDRRLQRLHDDVRQWRDQTSVGHDDHVDLGQTRPSDETAQQRHQQVERGARHPRQRAALDLVGIGQEVDDDGGWALRWLGLGQLEAR
jgi:hypothetical protein